MGQAVELLFGFGGVAPLYILFLFGFSHIITFVPAGFRPHYLQIKKQVAAKPRRRKAPAQPYTQPQ